MSFRKVMCLILAAAMLCAPVAPVQAQSAPWMPEPGTQVGTSPAFAPASLRGMVIDPNDPFRFDFLIYQGDIALPAGEKPQEYRRLIKYFLAALAIDDKNQWVNLSPYEKDRIIPEDFGLTEMGRDLLAQDYLLKQIASSLVAPDGDLGKDFWARVYSEAREKFGSAEVPAELINKVWIMPDKAVVYEKDRTVYVLENHLKVMLEADYLAIRSASAENPSAADPAQSIPRQIMREVILPALEKEVNEGKNFAPLRQVYSGMVLAAWYKRRLKDSILGRLYANQGKVQGVQQDDPQTNQKIFDEYVLALRKGAVNMIREDFDKYTQEIIPRRYFSGGTSGYVDPAMIEEKSSLSPVEGSRLQDEASRVDRVPTALERTGAPASQGAAEDIAEDDYLTTSEQDRVVARFFLKLRGRVAELGFPKAVIQKIGEGPSVPFRLRKSDEPLWTARLMAEAYLFALPLGEGILWVKAKAHPFEEVNLEFRRTLQRFFPEATEQEIDWARQRLVLSIHLRGKAWWERFRGDPWDFSFAPSALKQQEDKVLAPAVTETADRAQRVELLRSQWEGHLSRIVVPSDFSINDFMREDHPFREAVRAAVKRGDVMEIDISALAQRPDRYVAADGIFLGTGGTCQRTLAQGYEAITDVTFVLSELLLNAFVHGNKLDFSVPLFVVFKPTRDNKNVYELRVFDAASDQEADPQELALAKKASLTGQGQGIRQIEFDWHYVLEPALVKGQVAGNVAVAHPFSVDIFDTVDPEPEAQTQKELGGIDMNSANLDLLIRRDGEGVVLPADRQDLERIRIEGLIPVILDIQPAATLPLFSQSLAQPETKA